MLRILKSIERLISKMNSTTTSRNNRRCIGHFKDLKFFLRAFGLSLSENENILFKVYSTTILILCYIYGFVTFYDIFNINFDDLINTLFIQFAIFITLVKVLVVLQKRFSIGKILETLEKEPFIPNVNNSGGDTEENLVNECVWITNAQERVYGIAGFITIAISIGTTLKNRITNNNHYEWELPFHSITFVNVTYSPNYEIFCSCQIIVITYFVAHFILIDLTAAAVLAHISYQFKIVQVKIKNVIPASKTDMLKDSKDLRRVDANENSIIDVSLIPWKYLQKNLKSAIEYHLAVIEIAEEFENVFSGLLLVVFLSTLGMIALMIYHLSLLSIKDQRIYMAGLEFLGACMQTFLICYWGEQVLTESELVGRSAYETNFVGADLRLQKALIFIIRRSQNPITVTVKKFAVVNLTTFAWIFQKSYAAFAVLQDTSSDEL